MREIQTSVLPFELHRKTVFVPEGITLAEMVEIAVPRKVSGVTVVVNINDSNVPQEFWKIVRPKKSTIVSVNIIPAGGGGGDTGKQILSVVIAVAAVVASVYTGGASLAVGFKAALLIGINLTAALATSMLASVPSQNRNSGSRANNIAESPTQFIEGSSNAILRYGVTPINLGVNRMFPPQAALPYSETSGNEQYSRQLFTYGYGSVEISDLKIGETLLSDFNNVQTEHKLAGDLHTGVPLYPNDSFQENLSVLLEQAAGYSTRTTQQDTDEFIIDITFDRGLAKYDNVGNRLSVSVVLETEYKLTSSGSWTSLGTTTVTNATAEPVRISVRGIVPTKGQYNVRVRRVTADTVDDRIIDKFYWTAIKSITYGNPVLEQNLSGTALRILATDQLNGSVDRFNAVVSTLILQYNSGLDTWTVAVSSNPAAIYRHVLQSPAFIKNLDDSRIDIEKLEEWSIYCEEEGLTFNKIIDYETSIDEVLNDIAAAGMATPHKVYGIYSVIIDNIRPDIKGMVTPRNSWGYQGNINYPEIPHAFRVEFRNSSKGYETDERIVYADGYSLNNAELFERLQFASCTNPDLAYYYARRYLASAILQPELHTFNMDIENLSFNRGDRIVFVNDSILVGVGQGRIKELVYDDEESPTTLISFVLDDFVNIPNSNNFATRIRHADASAFTYYNLVTVLGETDTFTFTTPVPVEDAPGVGSLCTFVEDGLELDLIVKDIQLDKDYNARIAAINYAPARFDAASGVIPPFNSNVTLPIDFYQPLPPELDGEIVSDESVMTRNSDGSYTTRMVIPLLNKNTSGVDVVVRIRTTGATVWGKADTLVESPQKVIITGLQDSTTYDIHVYYQRNTGSMLMSKPLQLNGILFVGTGGTPEDVSGFKVTVYNGIGFFEWTPNTDIDLSHYILRFTTLTSGGLWENSQLLADNVQSNRVFFPIQVGTYLIKAVDLKGNQSDTATAIISFNSGTFLNVVESISGQTAWSGTKVNVQVEADDLILIDPTLTGYYYFDELDLSEVFESTISANIFSFPVEFLRIRAVPVIRDVARIRGFQGVRIRSYSSIRSLEKIRDISLSLWSVKLEMRTSDDAVIWSEWGEFITGTISFRAIQFRLVLKSFNENVSPKVITADILVNMPDRYETGEDIECPIGGATVSYTSAFKNNPSVNITLQDGDSNDRIDYISKNNQGFEIKIFNTTAGAFVARSFDYISAGYGRVS